MRVLLLQNFWTEHLGLSHLIACIKDQGHEAVLELVREPREAIQAAGRHSPDLVAFTATTGIHRWCEKTSAELKTAIPGTKTIIGGAHPTFFPELCLEAGFDFVCRNEGEVTMVELLKRLENGGEGMSEVPTLSWVDEDGVVHNNEEGHLVEDLESLPWADRSLHFRHKFLADSPYKFFMSNRGCPFQCTFCYAPAIKERMKGKGKWSRTRNVDSMVDEILAIKNKYGLKVVDFQDDIFGLNRKWLMEFAELYPKKVGLPFIANARIDQMTEDNTALFAQAGCYALSLGLEHGNEQLRNDMLDKRISNDKVLEVAERLHRHNIKFLTYNIFGLPGETFEQAMETVDLNRKMKTNWFRTSLFQPSPGTKLFKVMKERGFISEETAGLYMPNSIFQDTEKVSFTTTKIANLQKLFYLFVKFPQFEKTWLALLDLKPGVIHWVIFFTTYGYCITRFRRMSLLHMMRVAWHEVNLFMHR